MALDRITEEIAHFVGLFQLEAEAAKLRLDYEAFRIKADAPALDPVRDNPFAGKSDLKEHSVKTGLSHKDQPAATAEPQAPMAAALAALGTVPAQPAPLAEVPTQTAPAPLMNGTTVSGPMVEILPNSIVMAVAQTAVLSDDDRLIFDGSAKFVETTQLTDLIGLAQALSPITPWTWSPAEGGASEAAMQLAKAMTAVAAAEVAEIAEIEGLATVILRGEATDGIFINGEITEAPPSLDDLMPAFLQPEVEDAAGPDAGFKPDGVTDHDPGPFVLDPGHHVVSGGNMVINETVLKSVWVDAPVIGVAKDAVRLDVISQINIRVESAALPDQALPAPSTSLNLAQMEQTSSLAKGPSEPFESEGEGLPSFWNVTRVEGDLLLMNWVQQHIFVSDQDWIEVKFTGAATYIGTGENLVFNETLGLDLGFHYDLILIGGSLITINQIMQINVLLDQDRVTGEVPVGAKLLAGDNLQANSAGIMTTGKDSVADKTDMLDQALSDLAGGATDIPAGLAQDALFAGKAALNVLYIAGDLIQTSVIEQVNYLGDSDQIHFIKDMFSTADGAEVTVTSGSNAQINMATVISVGLDSTVMAGGETYSDALIYQAELIDDCAPPTGVQIGGLANEAVAFLVDGMIDPGPSDDAGSGFHAVDGPGAVDVMQTMLT